MKTIWTKLTASIWCPRQTMQSAFGIPFPPTSNAFSRWLIYLMGEPARGNWRQKWEEWVFLICASLLPPPLIFTGPCNHLPLGCPCVIQRDGIGGGGGNGENLVLPPQLPCIWRASLGDHTGWPSAQASPENSFLFYATVPPFLCFHLEWWQSQETFEGAQQVV